MIALALALAAVPAGERPAIGVWDRWAALRDGRPPRCYAIAQPMTADGGTDRRGGYAGVVARANGTRRAIVFARLSRAPAPGAAVTLAIGERRFALVAAGLSARAPDAATDRAIVGAMRGGRSMSIAATDPAGRAFADSYALTGAATAIDAAALACAARG